MEYNKKKRGTKLEIRCRIMNSTRKEDVGEEIEKYEETESYLY
jgi:hypothetical protein